MELGGQAAGRLLDIMCYFWANSLIKILHSIAFVIKYHIIMAKKYKP